MDVLQQMGEKKRFQVSGAPVSCQRLPVPHISQVLHLPSCTPGGLLSHPFFCDKPRWQIHMFD